MFYETSTDQRKPTHPPDQESSTSNAEQFRPIVPIAVNLRTFPCSVSSLSSGSPSYLRFTDLSRGEGVALYLSAKRSPNDVRRGEYVAPTGLWSRGCL
jgi:hypothetical protein